MKIFKTLQYMFTIIAVGAGISLLSGCSDELSLRSPGEVPDGYMRINFGIAEDTHIVTRGDDNLSERGVNSLAILIFNSEGTKILQRFDADINSIEGINQESTERNSFNFTFPLNKEAKKESNRIVYALANAIPRETGITDWIADFTEGTNKSVTQLEGVIVDRHYGIGNGFLMSGKLTDVSENSIKIELKRSMGKISLKDESGNSSFYLSGFNLYHTANSGYLTAAQLSNPIIAGNEREPIAAGKVEEDNGVERWDAYALPTQTHTEENDESSVKTFVVIHGLYNGSDSYYAVALYDKDKTEGDKFYDILPNRWYEMQITKVTGAGYASEEEALQHPMPLNIDIEIHDHVAQVFSMISDGIRELGTREKVEMTADTYDLIVKCFSKFEDEEEEKPKVRITSGNDWLSVAQSGEKTNAETGGDHEDNPGTQWKFTLSKAEGVSMYSDRSAIIEVTWKNLKRIVEVVYNVEFNPEDACSAGLYRFGNGTMISTVDLDYWAFLKSSLHGISPEEMEGGKVRNEGFHFPMPYYFDTNPDVLVEYRYYLDFSKMINESMRSKVEKITVSTTGDSFFTGSIKWENPATVNGSEANYKGILSLDQSKLNDYTYAIGKITFTMSFTDDTPDQSVTFDLYHTGFFYQHNCFTNDQAKRGYLYYEVISLGGTHWLDRNIGATSNKMYVNNGTDGGDGGDSDAAGVFFTIAKPGEDYGDPTLITADTETACPPGYAIPNSADWDKIRFSSRFVNERINDGSQSYIASYYATGNSKIGNVYFPKSKFYNLGNSYGQNSKYVGLEDVNSGDNGAGYYWSSTPGQGLEKDQIGKWLKALYLSGSSNTFINGSITDHKMNVRCIAKIDQTSNDKYAIDFNVKGATHVFLYTEDSSGNKNGIFTFPGKAIGSESAVKGLDYSSPDNYILDQSFIHFSYSCSVSSENLKVLFAYVTAGGKITIISRNKATTLAAAEGWPVEIGYNYFFYWDSGMTSLDYDKTNIFRGHSATKFEKGDNVRIIWQKRQDEVNYTNCYIWSTDVGDFMTGGWPGEPGKDYGNGKLYIDLVDLTQNVDDLHISINDGKSDGTEKKKEKQYLITDSSISYDPDSEMFVIDMTQ